MLQETLQFFIAAFIAAFILFYFTCAAGISVIAHSFINIIMCPNNYIQ